MHLPRIAAPRVATIEGQRVLVVERRPPLPMRLDRLIAEMTLTFRAPITIRGWRPACGEQDHRFFVILEGRHTGHDGERRDLRLLQCADCEGIQVRDISHDRLPGLCTGSLAVRRRDHVLGWYSGARRGSREYR